MMAGLGGNIIDIHGHMRPIPGGVLDLHDIKPGRGDIEDA
jgi:hypothetical protein